MKKHIHRKIAEQAMVGVDYIKQTQRLEEDLGLDSLDIIEISMAVENEIDAKVTKDEYSNWVTVEDVVDSYWFKLKEK